MRSIRRAAIAGATAAALLVGAASAATAEESNPPAATTTEKGNDKKDASSKVKGSSDKKEDKDGDKSSSKSSQGGSSSEAGPAEVVDRETFNKTKSALHMLSTGKAPQEEELAVWGKELQEIQEELAKDEDFQKASKEERQEMISAAFKAKVAEFIENIKGNPGIFRDGKIKTADPAGKDGFEYLIIPDKFAMGSAKLGLKLEAEKSVNGRAVFGSAKSDFNELPKWAKALKIVTIIGAIGSMLGLVAFPVYNFLLANGYIR